MSGMEIWQKVALPIIQFLIGPAIAGYIVWYLTNKKAVKKEEDEAKRQFNAIISKLKRVIQLVEELNKELAKLDEYKPRIEEMRLGDYSAVQDEVSDIGSEENCLRLFEDLQSSAHRRIGRLRKDINSVAGELEALPKESVPPKPHGELLEIIESKKVELDLVKHKSLLKRFEKLV